MSAFVVSDSTINRVVSWINNETVGSNGLTYGRIGRILKGIGHAPDQDNFEVNLGLAMFDLNVLAVNQRYGDGEAEKFRPLDYAFKPATPGSVYQALKSLHCWHYQCAEGDVPETEFYKAFESVIHAIEGGIVSRLPQYEAAQWD